MSGLVLAQLLDFLLSPVISRLYVPYAFGVLSIFLSLVNILNSISSFRIEQAILLPKEDEDSKDLTRVSISLLLFTSIVATIIVFLLPKELIAKFDIKEEDQYLLNFIGPAVLIFGFTFILNIRQNFRHDYKNIAVSKILQSVGTNGAQISLAYGGLGAAGLILGKMIGGALSSLFLYFNVLIKDKIKSFASIDLIKENVKTYKDQVTSNTPHSLLTSMTGNIPILLLGIFFSPVAAGLYGFSYRVCYTPVKIISRSISNVLNKQLTEQFNQNIPGRRLVLKLIVVSLGISIPLNLTLFIWGPQLFRFVFGKDWMEAGIYARLLTPWFVLSFIASILSFIPIIYNRQRKALVLEVISLIMRLLGFAIGIIIGSVYFAIASYSILGSLILGYYILWIMKLTKRLPHNVVYFKLGESYEE